MGIETTFNFGLCNMSFDHDVNGIAFGDQDLTKTYVWSCDKSNKTITESFNKLEKSGGCRFCVSNLLSDYSKLPHKELIEDITNNWESNYQRGQKKMDAEMYASLIDKQNIKLVEQIVDKYKTFKEMRSNVFENHPIPLEKDIYEKKVDLSNSAFKRYSKTLNHQNDGLDWFQRNQDILAEAKFLGSFSLSSMWHSFAVWHRITDDHLVAQYKEELGEATNYISALIFPNKENQNPYTVLYPSFKSDAELDQLARSSSAFDHKSLNLKPQQKVIMLEFQQVEGASNMLNDEEYGLKEFMNVKRVPINTIQQRFAYIRNHLCGVSQNRLAYYLDDKGITIDQKGVRYWEEKETDEPSFVKNHLDDVIEVFTELSYALLHTPMRLDMERTFPDMPYSEITYQQVGMLIEDFLLYGSENSSRYSFPEIILNTTDLSKTEADIMWESATNKNIIEVKSKPVDPKTVSTNPSYVSLWIDLLLDKTEKEVIDDLNEFYGKEDDYKKPVFFLWNNIHNKYTREIKKRRQEAPFD